MKNMNSLKDQIYTLVKEDLEKVEIELEKNLDPHFELVSQVAKHIMFSGGKRLRPLIMLLSSRLCGYEGEMAEKFSIIFEYLHTATLLHDDIVDGAEIRRGEKVANALWDTPTTVLTGDFLLARALSITSEIGNIKAVSIIAKLTEKMAQGEIEQLAKRNDLNLTEAAYRKIIEYKTAALIEGACKVGAIISNAPKKKEDALSSFGYNLGIAFQLVDDLLDYTSKTAVFGKKTGADLKEGKLTLPFIHALSKADFEDAEFIRLLIIKKEFDKKKFEKLLTILKKYKSIDYTKQAAKKHIEKAKKFLEIFAKSKNKEVLTFIADYVLMRNL
jgi:octaprenyl-diphosphate synthase